MLSQLLNTPATILRRSADGGEDEFGNPTQGVEEVEISCALQAAGRSRATEKDEYGEISDTTWKLFLPIGADIDSGDAVVVKGRKYELVGDPWNAEEGSSRMWHVEAFARRTATQGDDEAEE